MSIVTSGWNIRIIMFTTSIISMSTPLALTRPSRTPTNQGRTHTLISLILIIGMTTKQTRHRKAKLFCYE